MSIYILPEDVLLEVFDFFAEIDEAIEAWQTLVHVCRRWRSIVFGSSRRLNLRLLCSNKTPARDMLDVWPALPLFIECNETAESVDNIVAVLERRDRVRYIGLTWIKSSDFGKISAAMQVPFPELTHLHLFLIDEIDKTMSVLPDSFLGGSAPRLEDLWLDGIPLPGLPKLLLSVTHLVTLHLRSIPHSGYFSPEAIVTTLSTLTRLESLRLLFASPQPRPDPARRRPPPPTRSVLPTLTHFRFKGVSEYLEAVVARIDAPRPNSLYMTLFNDIVFDTPHFNRFISCTPTLMALEEARVMFKNGAATVEVSSRTSGKYDSEEVELGVTVLCKEMDWQVSSMEQVCTSCLPPLPALENLYIYENTLRQHWQDNTENALWLELLHPFTSVRNLYLSEHIAQRIVPALRDLVGSRATEVLPTLQNIFLEGQPSGPVQEGIQHVVTVRQATGHPITVSYGQEVRY